MNARMLRPQVRDAGDAAVLAELPARMDPMTNAAVLRLADRLRATGIRGVRDIVPAIRSLAVFFDPLHTDVDALRQALTDQVLEPDIAAEGPRHEVPVVYGGESGPDLEEVARASGLSLAALIERHAGRDYRVYMLGFLPGFAYLGVVDRAISASRRAAPRIRVPAGSVGVAGRQSGVYPRESPGGWALVGRTPLPVFVATRPRPALFAPGDRVRFHPVSESIWPDEDPSAGGVVQALRPALAVVHAGLFTTVQDRGRWGHQAEGVAVAGAMDPLAHRIANALVGNESSAATLEMTVSGPELRCLEECVIAVSGADFGLRVDGRFMPPDVPVGVPAGSVIAFAGRRDGARTYLACAGGIAVPPVLGSRATHVPSGLGGVAGRALRAGDWLAVAPRGPLPTGRRAVPAVKRSGGGATVRILPGPQADAFPAEAMMCLTAGRFTVSSDSNRTGYRLKGAQVPSPAGEMLSDVTFPGAVQIPPSGEPILLMADRQTTGGYPQLAVVASADLPLVGQLAPGDWVSFHLTTRREAVAALADQERLMQHLEGHAFA